jgi:hypothetical protein
MIFLGMGLGGIETCKTLKKKLKMQKITEKIEKFVFYWYKICLFFW